MEAREVLERVEVAEHAAESRENFGRHAAVLVSVLAALLAIATLAGNRATTEALLAQQKASDAWNEFQANSLKRHINEGEASLLRSLAAGGPSGAEAERRAADLDDAVATKYRPNQDQLQHKAEDLEHERDLAESRHRSFQVSEAAFQLAIVLASISIVARALPLLWGGAGLGIVGLLLLLNAFALAVPLPV
ncbi:MAG TPA: DUF4337 domain-containing protein [Chloroflexota bacterium]